MAEGIGARMEGAAFDEAAGTYDTDFAGTVTGVWLRQSVWSQLAPFVKPGMRALDLGCGTGEDALWLARNGCDVTAADGSPAMLERVSAKAAMSGLGDRIRTQVLDLNAECEPPPGYPFDVVISNFGAVNCVGDLGALGAKLARWVRPGGTVALVFMGRFCAWESAYYLARLDARAFRRLKGRATAPVGSRRVNVAYWSKGEMRRALGPSFRAVSVHGVGTFLPPSYLFHWVDRRPRLFRALARLDRCTSRLWPLSRMGDHMLLIARRSDRAAPQGGAS